MSSCASCARSSRGRRRIGTTFTPTSASAIGSRRSLHTTPSATKRAMLIVNADDFGANPRTSDPVVELFIEGAVSSASAMVWMRDTVRAASLAAEHGVPVGLHLNLTLPFADEAVPALVRERQLRLTEIFGSESWQGDGRESADGKLIADAIADQLERFREAFGEPTHVDGHHHVHTHPAVVEH